MIAGSLFSGCGGMDLGLEWAGIGIAWQVEINKDCLKILERHWPEVPKYGDIRTVGKHNLSPVDLICGGPPCQPASVSGKRRGAEDDRWLWPEAVRIVRELLPPWLLFENPPGICSLVQFDETLEVDERIYAREEMASGRFAVGRSVEREGRGVLDAILEDLEEIGYEVEAFIVPAQGINAPHERARVWIVGHALGLGSHGKHGGRAGAEPENGCEGMADCAGGGREGKQGDEGQGPPLRRGIKPGGENGPGELENPDEPGLQDGQQRRGIGPPNGSGAGRPTKPRLGGVLDGLSAWLDGTRWPAPPGSYQHEWEPPRTIRGLKGRRARIEMLGNAVVPQVVTLIGQAIMEAMEPPGGDKEE